MMLETQELSTNMWHKTGSDISRKVTPASKTNQGQGDLVIDVALFEMVKKQPRQALIHCQQNLVLH